MTTQIQVHTDNNTPLQLNPITVNEDYCKKWNINQKDFVLLSRNDKPLRDTLYRIGGMGSVNDLKNNYFLLLKHIEAYYDDSITKITKDKPHLEDCWCILDKYGNEKVTVNQFKHPYLVKNSVIYSLESKYYNIETGYFYCHSYTYMDSGEYLFLNNEYDEDKSKRGVMKINKKTGTFEMFN